MITHNQKNITNFIQLSYIIKLLDVYNTLSANQFPMDTKDIGDIKDIV